jgi:hypothetical protein
MNCAVEQFHPSPIFKHSFNVSVSERGAPEAAKGNPREACS